MTMVFPSDLDIARRARLKPLADVADEMGVGEHLLEPYGDNVAKIKLEGIDELAGVPPARYVVVSAITPTPLGEGKTTTTVGLGQAFRHIVLATPEPASALLVSVDGRRWETIETQRVGGPDSVGGPFRRSGHYVAAIPGVSPPRSGSPGWLKTGRQVLIVILSLALVVNLVGRARQRPRTVPAKGE